VTLDRGAVHEWPRPLLLSHSRRRFASLPTRSIGDSTLATIRVFSNNLRVGIGIVLLIIGATQRNGFVVAAGLLLLLSAFLPRK
jgi:hypothetical protein